MTQYTPQAISNFLASTPTYGNAGVTYGAAAAGGDKVAISSNEREFIHVKNATGGSSCTVTVAAQVSSIYQEGAGNMVPPSMTVTIASPGEAFLGPFPASYVDIAGNVNIAYSEVTGITMAALRLPAVSKSFN